jgi:hypothetical protein
MLRRRWSQSYRRVGPLARAFAASSGPSSGAAAEAQKPSDIARINRLLDAMDVVFTANRRNIILAVAKQFVDNKFECLDHNQRYAAVAAAAPLLLLPLLLAHPDDAFAFQLRRCRRCVTVTPALLWICR